MGVPKFFRYISERYPCLSESVKNYEIPTFDNLYLDMNGIIHMCTHPDDTDCSFRISEQKIYENIFHYIEILFSIIKPQKLFFMAVDGVAPRAKMNQQRGRRFRAAKEAEILMAKAKAKGEELPDTPRFDSNCITPGTTFMARLNEQLKYFVTYKITKDKLWRKCKIIFSGHETPGEGEHKIMDYIRYMKTQPDYDNNTRHCLYGLDADLIMLSLCTHEPHFSLLREEVKFVKKQKRSVTPEEIKFCLLHLSLMREYLEHEFSSIKDKLPFPFDIEKIIDDWVLMGFLVGNDFIPNLPNLHITNGSLSVLYHAYMEVLPTLDGYINESGTLKLDRFEKFMEKLSHVDMEQFVEHYVDLKYFESKTGRRPNECDTQSNDVSENTSEEITPTKNKELEDLIKSTDDMMENSDEEELSDLEDKTAEFIQHKRDYYMRKLEYKDVTESVLRSQAEGYIRAIQWNLNYYYNGCCSWSWYYPHHYAPYISDIKDFKDMKLQFELGEPFLPFQQLLAVLPAASKDLLPEPFQQLLTKESSPIINCYPTDFITDLNGKKQEWEAVVLIPFINEKSLLDAMEPYYAELTPEELNRNKHGPMCIYTHNEEDLGSYYAPDYFPEIQNNHAKLELLNREDIFVPQEKLVRGLCAGVRLSVYYPGFPTLWHIKHTARLLKAKVKVFEQSSRNDNMILFINPKETPKLTDLTDELLGESVFVAWPHLVEARVVALSNQECKISLFDPLMERNSENIRKEEVKGSLAAEWNLQRKAFIEKYKNSLGIDVGNTDILVHACTLIGKKYIFDTQGKFRVEKQWNERSVVYAYQTVLNNIEVHNSNSIQYNDIKEIFIPKSTCFMLGHPHYGAMGEVIEPGVNLKTSRVKVAMRITPLPDLDCIKKDYAELKAPYMHGSVAAQRLGISSHLLSRITGTIYVIEGSKEQSILEKSENPKHNVGLNLKFNKKNEEIPGYTRKDNGQWFYSIKSVNLIRAYMQKCPGLFEQMVKNVTNDVFYEDELFSERLKLNDVVSWLHSQPFYNLERRACGTESLDIEVIQKLEKEVDGFMKSRNNTSKSVVMQVKPHLLFVPGLNSSNLPPDMAARHEICDRIVCVRENFTVPLGYKGTIIGIQRKETSLEHIYDILFDEPLLGGLSLNTQSNNRGYRLRIGDFINISHGIRVESVKTGKTNVNTFVPGFMSLPPQHNQSRFNASGFVPLQNRSSFPPTGFKNIYPGHVSQMHALRNNELTYQSNRTMHVYESQKKAQHEPRIVSNYVTQNSEQSLSVQTVQKPTTEQATEFQALWNELHKLRKTNDSTPKSVSVPTSVKPKQIASTNADSPQDPSAYLKAMLKISDEKSHNNTRIVTPLSNRKLPTFSQADTPPLVKQLFDHARQIEDKKNEILYCSAILTHFQLNGMGMPQYTYLSNNDTTLVCAQIVLPDMRIFTGEFCSTKELAAESAAKKVYKELNLDKAPKVGMNMLVTPPQQWYNCRQTNVRSQNIRPVMIHGPPQIPATAQNPLMNVYKWNSKVQQNSPFTPMPHSSGQNRPQQRQNYSTEQNTSKNWRIPDKPESKKIAPFVPLQAQKQSRNVGSKSVKKDNDRNSNKPPQSRVPKEKPKEAPAKETKEETLNIADQKVPRGQNNSQNQQKTPKKQRKSRIAANFGTERGQAQ